MLVIKKRSKLIKSLSAGVVMFAVGLTGSVAYLDATTPSGDFVYNTDRGTVARTGPSVGEASASESTTGDQSSGATSSSSDQTGHVAPLAGSGQGVTSETNVPAVEQTVPVVEAPYVGTPPDEDPSLIDGILNMLP